MPAAALVLAGGTGSRVGADGNKVYLPLAGRRLVSWSLNTMLATPGVERVVLVVRAEEHDQARRILAREAAGPVELVTGGTTRHSSEFCGLTALADDITSGSIDVVAIHDGARPLATASLIARVVAAARAYGAALPAIAVDDVGMIDDDRVGALEPLRRLVRVQTPQAFAAGPLLDAYSKADLDGFAGSDTAACIERYTDLAVHCLPGDARNLKVTFARDLFLAERLLAGMNYRLV